MHADSLRNINHTGDADSADRNNNAFDRNGNRLGRGKGYYDRLLKKLPDRINSIGLAFDFQVLPELPLEENDVPVDKVLSA